MLLLQGLSVDRRRPDIAALAGEQRPERFVWRVLPHAARSFAASIVVLPPDQARASAVAYLYCRMLDTYEDLLPDPVVRTAELKRFAARFDAEEMPAPTLIDADLARTDRDAVYLLLLARCRLVDAVFATLPRDVQAQIAHLVRSMAEGMVWSTAAFASQGGVLVDEEQVVHYCRNVIGHPAVFVIELLAASEISEPAREDAYLVAEMVQLANVTRDIESDLARGVAYHPALKPYLGTTLDHAETRSVIRDVRKEYVALALGRAAAYRRLFDGLDLGDTAAVRTAAVLMLLFTDLHYRGCAVSVGNAGWPGPRDRRSVIARSLPALVSSRWAARMLRRVERDFLSAADGYRPSSLATGASPE